MAQYKHLPIYKASYDLLIHIMNTTKHFPKEFKFSLGEKLQNSVVELILDVYKANSAKERTLFLEDALEKIQSINLFIRIAFDMKIITQSAYCSLVEQVSDLSKQAQGWLSASKNLT